jgi:hypothetical protein
VVVVERLMQHQIQAVLAVEVLEIMDLVAVNLALLEHLAKAMLVEMALPMVLLILKALAVVVLELLVAMEELEY